MERLGGEVRHALRGVGVPDAGALAEISRVWPAAVGDAISRAAWPLRMSRDGTLHVATVSSAWSFELACSRRRSWPSSARRSEHSADGPPLRGGPVPEPGPRRRSLRCAGTTTAGPEERRLAAELTASLSDEELRGQSRGRLPQASRGPLPTARF